MNIRHKKILSSKTTRDGFRKVVGTPILISKKFLGNGNHCHVSVAIAVLLHHIAFSRMESVR
jgi:hypothetical protein